MKTCMMISSDWAAKRLIRSKTNRFNVSGGILNDGLSYAVRHAELVSASPENKEIAGQARNDAGQACNAGKIVYKSATNNKYEHITIVESYKTMSSKHITQISSKDIFVKNPKNPFFLYFGMFFVEACNSRERERERERERI